MHRSQQIRTTTMIAVALAFCFGAAVFLAVAAVRSGNPAGAANAVLVLAVVLSLGTVLLLAGVAVFTLATARAVKTVLATTAAQSPQIFREPPPTALRPNLATDPLVLRWRIESWLRWYSAAQTVAILSLVVAQIGKYLTLPPIDPWLSWGLWFGVVIFLILAIQAWLARPSGISVTEEGITTYGPLERRRSLRWDEARSLEYRIGTSKYVLRDTSRSVTWRRSAPGGADPVGITRDEVQQRWPLIVATVAARTGLQPQVIAR